jgi:hypothetical protein
LLYSCRSIQDLLQTGHSTGAANFPRLNFGCAAGTAFGHDERMRFEGPVLETTEHFNGVKNQHKALAD